MGYRQLTRTQPYQIHAHHDLDISQRQIGRELGLQTSTITSELHRNPNYGGCDLEKSYGDFWCTGEGGRGGVSS
jgi:transposase, IS30 family